MLLCVKIMVILLLESTMKYIITDDFLRNAFKTFYWGSYGNENDVFTKDVNEIQVHLGQFTNAISNLKNSANYFPDEIFDVWSETVSELNKKYPRPNSNDYQSYRLINAQDFKKLQSTIKEITLNLSDEQTCIKLFYSYHKLINHSKFNIDDFNKVFGEKEGREIIYQTLNGYIKDKNIKSYSVLPHKDEVTGKILRVWTEEFLKHNQKMSLKDIINFLFERNLFSVSICTINGLKLVSKFLFDYIAANGASNDEFIEAFNVCKENISKYNKFKALDTLEALAKKNKVSFENSAEDKSSNRDVYYDMFDSIKVNREYSFSKDRFNKLFKLKEKEQTEFERKISFELKEGFNQFFKTSTVFNDFSADLIGSAKSGSFGICITYFINNSNNTQQALDIIDIIMKKAMNAIVHSTYEQVYAWGSEIVFHFYEEHNSEVLKGHLDKNMAEVSTDIDEGVDEQESEYKI